MSAIELKPCPFCGGTAVTSVYGFAVGCEDADCPGNGCMEVSWDTQEEAAAMWNRRAERTCRPASFGDNAKAGTFVPQMIGTFCSECGDDLHRDRFTGKYPNYCKNCGSKVVEP